MNAHSGRPLLLAVAATWSHLSGENVSTISFPYRRSFGLNVTRYLCLGVAIGVVGSGVVLGLYVFSIQNSSVTGHLYIQFRSFHLALLFKSTATHDGLQVESRVAGIQLYTTPLYLSGGGGGGTSDRNAKQ